MGSQRVRHDWIELNLLRWIPWCQISEASEHLSFLPIPLTVPYSCYDFPFNFLLLLLLYVCSVISDSLRPHELWPTKLLCPWNSPGRNTGLGCHSLHPGFFLTQGSNLCLLRLVHCRQRLYYHWALQFSSVHLLSHVWLFVIPWTAACQASLSITNSWSSLKLMSIKSVMSSNHFILCWPLLLLTSVFPGIKVFFNESVLCIRWPKYWNFSFSITLSMNIQDWSPLEWTGLISLQSKGLSRVFSNNKVKKDSILQCSAFFIVQLSHPYMTSEKP